MKPCKAVKPQSALHLVTPEEKLPEPSPQELDSFIADGVRSYQKLQEEFDRELFGPRDIEKLGSLIEQKQLIRSRLMAYGVRVRA